VAEPLSVRTPEEIEAVAAAAEEQRQRRRYIFHALLRSPTFIVGGAILLFWIVMALFSTVFSADPYAIDTAHTLAAPGGAHLFGTDATGRDVLARTLAGARPVLIIAPLATLLALAAGTVIGLVAGFYRGVVDEVLMRLVDVLLCLPVIVLALFVLSVLNSKSSWIVILVIAIVFTPLVSRTVRSTVIGEREREYVMAARLRGERASFIMLGEVLPNILPPIIVEATVRLGYAVFTSATLSFLGQGLQPPSPDWGLTIAQNVSVLQVAWWTVIFPADALATLVVSVNLMADGLRRVITR
jgi:peptide/nickel transport system permease protein